MGHTQTRNRGTVGGSLMHADPAAELPLVARVLGATLMLRSVEGVRAVRADEFFLAPLTTAARPDECLEEIHWPLWDEPHSGSAFVETSRRHGDFAIVAAAAQIYKLHGKSANLLVEHPDCDHDFPDAMREKAYKLFETHLRAP